MLREVTQLAVFRKRIATLTVIMEMGKRKEHVLFTKTVKLPED